MVNVNSQTSRFQFSLQTLILVILGIGLASLAGQFLYDYSKKLKYSSDSTTGVAIQFEDGTSKRVGTGSMTIYYFGKDIKFTHLLNLLNTRNSKMLNIPDQSLSYELTRDDRILIRAADLLGKTRDQTALKPLMELLNDPCRRVRGSAVSSLRRFGDKRALPALFQQLRLHRSANGQLLSAIIALGDESIIPNLIDTIQVGPHYSFSKRMSAIETISGKSLKRLRDKWKFVGRDNLPKFRRELHMWWKFRQIEERVRKLSNLPPPKKIAR